MAVALLQEYVAELAQKCEMMLPQLAHLAEAGDLTDEKNLNQTLVVHAEMEESLAKYHRLLDVSPPFHHCSYLPAIVLLAVDVPPHICTSAFVPVTSMNGRV